MREVLMALAGLGIATAIGLLTALVLNYRHDDGWGS